MKKQTKQVKLFNNKNWLKFQGGDPLILESQMPKFIDAVKQIIPKLPVKNFESLRKQVLPVIKELRSERGKGSKENIFSYHVWYDILEEQPELKKIWNSRASFETPQESDLEITEILKHEEESKCDFIQKQENFTRDLPSLNITELFLQYKYITDQIKDLETRFFQCK